uniref:Glycosyltransferase 2-like domain-containing protein n=1 Tax=Alexandrium monilatum TaxID=311494 RepID=A0A7S4RP64_9DINO
MQGKGAPRPGKGHPGPGPGVMPAAAARGPPLPQGGYPMAAQPKAPLQQPRPVPTSIEVLMDPDGFEESLKLEWRLDNEAQKAMVRDFQVEMVLDLRKPEEMEQAGPLEPAKGATVKRVSMGQDMGGTIQNMPDGRNFLVSVVGKGPGGALVCRSPWTRVWTLSPKTRPKDLSNVDPFGKRRVSCLHCPCPQYVPMRWSLNSGEKLRCRRCGCHCQDHKEQEVGAILRAREEKASKALRKANLTPLPPEAVDWDSRECDLWFYTDGVVHPRATVGEHRERVREDALVRPGGAEGLNGKAGRVSVVTPTTDSRHHFHEVLWQVFEAQTWPDKELVIVETYTHKYSEFFHELARRDPRVVYVRFQRPAGEDWSIGLKRNIGAHLATGELIVNFDDDDIYGPTYLSTMIKAMYEHNVAFVTLSSWYFFDIKSGRFGFFDAEEWAKVKKMAKKDIDGWLWGYGFSYLHKLQPALDKKIRYPDQNMEEDIIYIRAWKEGFGDQCAALHFDGTGIVCHTLHGRNTSNSFALREVPREEMWDTDVAELWGCLTFYMGMFPRQQERSQFIESEADIETVQRRMVDRTVHWLKGDFSVSAPRGARVLDMKQACARRLCMTMDSFQLFRRVPKSGFVNLEVSPLEELQEKTHSQDPPPATSEDAPAQAEAHNPIFGHMLGTWVYGSKATEYVLSETGDGQLMFQGPHSRVGTVSGICYGAGLWAQADLCAPEGDKIGHIRLRHIAQADRMISNFKSLNREEWGKDIHAVRKGSMGASEDPASAGAESPSMHSVSSPQSGAAESPSHLPKEQLPPEAPPAKVEENLPLQDEERVGAYVEELWLVIYSQDAFAGMMSRGAAQAPQQSMPPPPSPAGPKREDIPEADPVPAPAAVAPPAAGRKPAEKISVVVHIDQALNLREMITVARGDPLICVKEQLRKRDVTGQAKASDFKLALEGGEDRVELRDNFKLTGDVTELVLLT